ncbi:hypothetical protein [Paenibacillus sp. PL91]|uniref:hypothetical protein n=1 Tax=Paenibacillus sp. PL91 TaxID=2729538 RepID=UPI00145D6F67|nr:hypothetical protein [Paenibacillus sp. PL91]MBC9201089.1 hypothetical protein [Paenibacillus sp. PL91]
MMKFSILFSPLMATVIIGVGIRPGWTDMPQSTSSYLAAFGMALLPSLFKNIFEEL